MTKTEPVLNQSGYSEKSEAWFEKFLATIEIDRMMLETNTAGEEKRRMYDNLINNNSEEIFKEFRKSSSRLFIGKLVSEYVSLLLEKDVDLKKLAFELGDSKVLVWAEIKADDEDAEKNLLLSEAKVNYEFAEYGFHISSMIVEDCDQLPVPSHYHLLPFPNQKHSILH